MEFRFIVNEKGKEKSTNVNIAYQSSKNYINSEHS